MRKLTLVAATAMLALLTVCAPVQAAGRGGVMGFIAGCCFGVRAGGAYNDGKEIHWREWVMLVPFANIVFSIWNGVDGNNGVTTSDYAKQYGTAFY